MAILVDLGPVKKEDKLIDLGPAPTPIMEAIQEVEAPVQEDFDPNKPIPFRRDIIPPTGIPEIADPQDVTIGGISPIAPTPVKKPKAVRPRWDEFVDATGRGIARVGAAGAQALAGIRGMPQPPGAWAPPESPERIKIRKKSAAKLRKGAEFLWKLSQNPGIAAQNKDLASKALNLIGETIPYITATTAAFVAAGPTGAFAVGSLVEGNSAYRTALDAGVPESKAKQIGIGVGIISGAVEAFGGRYAEQLALKAIAKLKSKLVKTGAVFGIGTVVEALEEGAQEVAQITGEETYRDVNWTERATRILSAMAGGGFLGGIMRGGGMAARGVVSAAEAVPTKPAKVEAVPTKRLVKVTPQKRTQAIEFVKSVLKQEQYAALDEKARIELGQRMLAEQGIKVEAEELVAKPIVGGPRLKATFEVPPLEVPPTEAIVAPEPTPKPITPEKAVKAPVSLIRPERRMYGMNMTKEQAEKLAQEIGGEAEGYGKKWSVWKAKPVAGRKAEIAPVAKPEAPKKQFLDMTREEQVGYIESLRKKPIQELSLADYRDMHAKRFQPGASQWERGYIKNRASIDADYRKAIKAAEKLPAKRKAEIAPVTQPEAVGEKEIPKELELLAKEAKKHKSVEEWRKFDEDKEISKVLTAIGKYSEKNELLRKWGGDKSDIDIITDFYNQVAKPKAVELEKSVKPKAIEVKFEIEPGKFYTQAKIDEAITKGEMGEIEIEPTLETESKSFNKHIDYFQGRQLPETSQIRKLQKQMQVVNGKRLAGTITAKEANTKIRQLRKLLLETAKKEGIALRTTKGGKVSVAVRKAGTYVPVEFAEYTKFKDISPMLGGGQDITRAIQQMDGSLTIKQKVREPGQAGQLEQNVLWPTRDMSLQKLKWQKEKAVKLKGFLEIRKRSKVDKQVNLVLEKIASQDRDIPIKKILSDKTLRNMASPAVIKQAIDLREFYDTLIDEQNIARKIRGQEEIPYRQKYSPHILRDATIWERVMMSGKKTENIFAKQADLPDYIRPNKPFNPREMAREAGMPYEKRITSARELAEIYLITAAKDIFNTSIIQNNKAFIQQLEAMGYAKSANYLAEWTATAYAGIKPGLERAIKLPKLAQKIMRKFTRVRDLAVFPFNFGWSAYTQVKSITRTIGRYGSPNTVRGFYRWLNPSIRKQAAQNYYSFIVKSQKYGRVSKQDAANLSEGNISLKRSVGEVIEDAGAILITEVEKILTGTSIEAARLHGGKRGLTGEALKQYASDGGGKTQEMYNREDKPMMLNSLHAKTFTPYQTFSFGLVNNLREWAGKTGTPPDTKLYAIWSLIRWLAAMAVMNMITNRIRGKNWSWWDMAPLPFREFWLSPIIAVLTKEYIPGASGLSSPVQTITEISKGIVDATEVGNWRKLRNATIKYGTGMVNIPGGVQWARMVDAIIIYSSGGLTDRRGRMMFEMKDPKDLARAMFSGVWTTKKGQEYLEKRTGAKKQTGERKKSLEREKKTLR